MKSPADTWGVRDGLGGDFVGGVGVVKSLLSGLIWVESWGFA
jgi:hypothetical protein